MAAPQIVPLPPFFQMSDGMRIVVTALDATTGAVVSGVIVANRSIDVDSDDVPPPKPPEDTGPVMFLPGQVV